jgi:uncharacterized protein YkwD
MRLQTTPALLPRATNVALALAFAASLLAVTLASAGPSLAFGGDGLRASANAYRAGEGVAPVAGTPLVDDIATKRAAQMVAAGKMEHDIGYVLDRLNRAGVCWSAVGEIIAWNGRSEYDYPATMLQWWESPTHHNIMVSPTYNAAGGAWATREGDGNYSVMVFVKLCGADVPQVAFGSTPFTDIGGSLYGGDIDWLYRQGITTGCTATSYCPGDPVTRAQMASFLDRALHLPDTGTDFFRDDDGTIHEAAINRLAAAGVTTGCRAGSFCPSGNVTRDQMASFLARALDLRGGSGWNAFDDDNDNLHEIDINKLAYDGVTVGCADRRYCPARGVTRGQMAAFLRRALSS